MGWSPRQETNYNIWLDKPFINLNMFVQKAREYFFFIIYLFL